MNTSNTDYDSHDAKARLDLHVAALRDVPTEAGPPEVTAAATLAMLRDARPRPEQMVTNRPRAGHDDGGRRRASLTERLIAMTFAQRLAAAVMVTGGALTLYFMFSLFSTFGTSVAFADVARKLGEARTLAFTSTVTLPGGQPPTTSKTFAAEPDLMRVEMPDGMVTIMRGHTSLTLNPAGRTATRLEISVAQTRPAGEDAAPHGIVAALRGLGAAKGEPAGEQEIDGVKAKGFRTDVGGMTMTVWADAKTALPLRIETRMPSAAGETLTVMDKFQVDPPLDDVLFAHDVPEGYALVTHKLDIATPANAEQAVADLLRAYADLNDGAFPPKLDDWQAYANAAKGDQDAQLKFSALLGGAMGHLFSLPQGYGYAGDGVNVGEKDKLVFWYQPTGEKETYRGVYGDLRVATVTKGELPETRPAAK